MNSYKNTFSLLGLSMLIATPVFAGSDNASEASKHSALAAGHSAIAGSQVVSGAVAVPLIVAGQLGEVSGEVGEHLLEHAVTPRKLEISDEVIVADPAPRQLHERREIGREGPVRKGGI